ncbi:MAG TPA: hypothetical protein VEZ44_15060 [bacterium]|nr:hypothetical protein [bacterium]
MKTTDNAAHVDVIHRAYRVAVRDLRACYNPDGIVAGRLHFNAYWARDGFWASFGALALGDYDQVASELDTFMRFQRTSGCVPVRLEFVGQTVGGYRRLLNRPKVVGRAGGIFADPVDPAALFIIAAAAYIARTGDVEFARRFEPAMDRAIGWLMRQDRDGDDLIESHFLADWMDSILKVDKILDLNVMYCVGLQACEAIKRAVGADRDAEQYLGLAGRVRERLQALFWNGDHFVDWIRGRGRGGFSSDGNVLAMFFRVATPEQTQRILEFIATRGLQDGTPLRTCYPVYPWWRVFPLYYFAGIPDYHRTLIWPWQGTILALCKDGRGDRAGALADLALIGTWYTRSNAVNEVYTPDGHPLSRRFYTAEVPFAWNAGMYVYAVEALGVRPGGEPRASQAVPPIVPHDIMKR